MGLLSKKQICDPPPVIQTPLRLKHVSESQINAHQVLLKPGFIVLAWSRKAVLTFPKSPQMMVACTTHLRQGKLTSEFLSISGAFATPLVDSLLMCVLESI